jgi:type VI secretion system ImpC/EvpB family protein
MAASPTGQPSFGGPSASVLSLQPAEGSPEVGGVLAGRAVLPKFLRDLAVASDGAAASPAGSLLDATSPAETLRAWAAARVAAGERLSRTELATRLGEDIAALDEVLSRQTDAILHHPRFQSLESSWRGLAWLVNQAAAADASEDDSGRVEVRVLNVSKRELARDRSSAMEFDRSVIWRKVYEEEFGTAGGTPFGLLLADYQFGNHPDDVNLLTGLTEVASASFSPLLTTPSPALMGIDSYAQLNTFVDLKTYQSGPDFVKWRALRSREESRFLGLPLPNVLGRLPYDGWIGQPEAEASVERSWEKRGFRYREQVDGPGTGNRLWISAIWPLAAVVLREFGRTGWFADIRGGSRGSEGGGLVDGLPVEGFDGFTLEAAARGPTEVLVTESTQAQLDEAGLIPLCGTGPDGRAVFHSNASLHEPEKFDTPIANANARISVMLQYMLCVSRFAHYLKVLARDRVGSFAEATDLEKFLNEWINQYVTPDDQASAEVRARLPLRAASVEVREEPGTAGAYRVIMRLQPHFQLDQIDASLKLVTTVHRSEQR